MSWVKLDDRFFRNAKVVEASPAARLLYLAALCWSAGELTDGAVPTKSLRRLGADADVDDPGGCAAELVRVGLWEPAASGYRIHDYLAYNLSRAEVLAKREADARRKRPPVGFPADSNGNPNGVASDSSGPVPQSEATTEGGAVDRSPHRSRSSYSQTQTRGRPREGPDSIRIPSGIQTESVGGLSAAEKDEEKDDETPWRRAPTRSQSNGARPQPTRRERDEARNRDINAKWAAIAAERSDDHAPPVLPDV